MMSGVPVTACFAEPIAFLIAKLLPLDSLLSGKCFKFDLQLKTLQHVQMQTVSKMLGIIHSFTL